MRRVANPSQSAPEDFAPAAPPAPEGFVRRAWLEAFEKDAADVAAGLYPAMTPGGPGPFEVQQPRYDAILHMDVAKMQITVGEGG